MQIVTIFVYILFLSLLLLFIDYFILLSIFYNCNTFFVRIHIVL